MQNLLLLFVKIFLSIVSPETCDSVIFKVAELELFVLGDEALRLLFILEHLESLNSVVACRIIQIFAICLRDSAHLA